jgi:hypothetical protein
VNAGSDATAYPPLFVFIRPQFKGAEGLLQHELTHIEIFWRQPITYYFKMLRKSFRMQNEIEAYRTSMKYHPERVDSFAMTLSKTFSPDLPFDIAKKLIQG